MQKRWHVQEGPYVKIDAELFCHVLWVIEFESGPKVIELKEIHGIPSYKKQ